MKFISGILILFYCSIVFGQETKKVTNKLSGYEEEVYYVLKNDPDIKHGNYTRYKFKDLVEKGSYTQNKRNGKWETYSNKTPESSGYYKDDLKDSTWSYYGWGGQLIAKGNYSNGERTGDWEYYENGVLMHRYDFTSRSLTYENPASAETPEKEFLIRLNGDTATVLLERRPVFLGGNMALLKFLAKNIKYPALAREKNIQGKVVLSFWITTSGTVTDIRILKPLSGGINEEAVRVIELMNEQARWAPGVYLNKPVETQYTIPVTFKLQ